MHRLPCYPVILQVYGVNMVMSLIRCTNHEADEAWLRTVWLLVVNRRRTVTLPHSAHDTDYKGARC